MTICSLSFICDGLWRTAGYDSALVVHQAILPLTPAGIGCSVRDTTTFRLPLATLLGIMDPTSPCTIIAPRSSCPSSVSPPGGMRCSRRVSFRLLLLPISCSYKGAGRLVDESTPLRYSHLSGTGDPELPEHARCIARLSLRMRPTTPC
ncbi:hypothetical protein C8Q74DRAFT_1301373 [Fomes fomentarius]|nr:hypothetical protein C8Q74DRAFT_1301373 [Fomes fomentarius]